MFHCGREEANGHCMIGSYLSRGSCSSLLTMESCQWHHRYRNDLSVLSDGGTSNHGHVKPYTEIRITRKQNRGLPLLKWRPPWSKPLRGIAHTCILASVCRVWTAIFMYSPYFISVKKAIGIINDVDESKFGRIVARVLQKLHMKVCLLVRALVRSYS